jgi:hypothetical protein
MDSGGVVSPIPNTPLAPALSSTSCACQGCGLSLSLHNLSIGLV